MEILILVIAVALFLVSGIVGLLLSKFISKNLIYKPERDSLFEELGKRYQLQFTNDADRIVYSLGALLKNNRTARAIQGVRNGREIVVGDFAIPFFSFNPRQNLQYMFLSPLITKYFVDGVEQSPATPFSSPLSTSDQISSFLDSIR